MISFMAQTSQAKTIVVAKQCKLGKKMQDCGALQKRNKHF